jgi:hypothetical protein
MPKAVELSERRFGCMQRELNAAVAALPRKGEASNYGDVAEMSNAKRAALEKFDEPAKPPRR